ncbi:MAG: hypothetical protein J7L96_09155, partial [Bacteroidales bacterium]|nr:hypothetical protein [Bacteroidales bacterium]
MRGTFLVTLLFCSFQIISAQKDTINQTNDEGLRIGYWVGHYPDGTMRYEANFQNGILVGEMKRFYPDGKLKALLARTARQALVTARLFDESNHVRATGCYKNQRKYGEWR